MMNRLEVLAPAKINLSLNVLSKRVDGYHEISSLMQAIELFDKVTVSISDNEFANEIKVNTSNKMLSNGSDNIAYKAANLMLNRFAVNSFQTIEIFIEKNIPMAAGLAGGSTDGAAVILALAELWELDVDFAELANVGSEIGADVAFCVSACAFANKNLRYRNDKKAVSIALAQGIGEKLTPITAGEKAWILLVKPDIEVSTPKVYGLVNDYGSDSGDSFLCEAIISSDIPSIFANMNNDLEKITSKEYLVVDSTIKKMKQFCLDAIVMMSGSGPTVFAFFPNMKQAEIAFDIAKNEFKDMEVFLVKTC